MDKKEKSMQILLPLKEVLVILPVMVVFLIYMENRKGCGKQ